MTWERIDCSGFNATGTPAYVFQSRLVAVWLDSESDVRLLWHFAGLEVDG